MTVHPKVKWSALFAALLALGAAIAQLTDWAFKQGEKNDSSGETINTLVTNDSLFVIWQKKVNRRLRLQSDSIRILTQRPREGWLRRQLRKVI